MEIEEQVHVHVSHVYGMDSTFNVFTCIHVHYSIMSLYVQLVYAKMPLSTFEASSVSISVSSSKMFPVDSNSNLRIESSILCKHSRRRRGVGTKREGY